MTDNLKQKTVKGIFWSFFDKGGTQVIQFIISIYIARILSPEDYGLIGMLTLFLIVGQLFVTGGFSQALVQKGGDVSQEDYNTAFYFNVIISVCFYLILFFCAPLIANFYNEPRLIILIKVLGLNLIILSVGLIQSTILTKSINFRKLANINLVSVLLAGIAGVLLAKKGYGVWALVALMLVESFSRSVLLWIFNKWRPGFIFSYESFKKLFSFGSLILLMGLVNEISNNLYTLIIGKFYTTVDVGYYSQAKKLQERSGNTVTASILGVIFPVTSLVKDDLPRLKNMTRTNIKITTFIVFPILIGLFAVATPFVKLALTDKWLPSVIYIQLLSVFGLFYSLYYLLSSVILVLGRVSLIFKITLISNSILLMLIFLSLFFKVGLVILVAARVLWIIINYILYAKYLNYYLNYSFLEQVKDYFTTLFCSVMMGLIVLFISNSIKISWNNFLVEIFAGISIYLILSLIFNRNIILKLFDFIKNTKNV